MSEEPKGYKRAMGAAPVPPGTELPEVIIRRMRGGCEEELARVEAAEADAERLAGLLEQAKGFLNRPFELGGRGWLRLPIDDDIDAALSAHRERGKETK